MAILLLILGIIVFLMVVGLIINLFSPDPSSPRPYGRRQDKEEQSEANLHDFLRSRSPPGSNKKDAA
jgi:hypothetical protein